MNCLTLNICHNNWKDKSEISIKGSDLDLSNATSVERKESTRRSKTAKLKKPVNKILTFNFTL